MARPYELAARRRVNPVVAGPLSRRARDAKVDFTCACVAHHLHDLTRRRSSNDGVVDDHDPLAFQDRRHGAQLETDAEMANALLRLDEGSPYVVGTDERRLERDASLGRVTDGGGHARVGDRNHDVGLYGVLAREHAPERISHFVDTLAME